MEPVTGIPEWFDQEHEDKNIWQPPFDYSKISQEIFELEQGLSAGWKETQVQAYLKPRPHLFDGLYRDGHGTFVFSELKFGTKYVADWVVGSGTSSGLSWELIELECPQSVPFIGSGHYSEATRKGVRQINDWRNWIKRNIDNVQRPLSRQGLGLDGLDDSAHGLVVVGRRDLYSDREAVGRYNEIRRVEKTTTRIDIISYDTLIERMKFRVKQFHA